MVSRTLFVLFGFVICALAPMHSAFAQEVAEAAKSDKADVAKTQEPKVLGSEFLLPASTKAWISIPDARVLEAQFDKTQIAKLINEPALEPFAKSIEEQLKSWVDEQNVRLGIKFDDLHGIHSGEICFAGVFPKIQGQEAAGTHGMVLLIRVSETKDKATALLKKINEEQVKAGAEKKSLNINGVVAQKFTVKNPKRFKKARVNLQVIVNDWLVVSDNESIFRDVLRRINAPSKIQAAETLAAHVAFSKVMENSKFGENETHVRWFVDPFGYIEFAQALENEKRVNRPRHDDWVSILKNQGFGAWQGIGGRVSVATSAHEVLHRTFTYAPKSNKENVKKMFEMFDFTGPALEPAEWVPADCSGHLNFNWQFSKALESVGGLVDAFIGEPGDFDRILEEMKIDVDTPLDVRKLVGLLNNQAIVVSDLKRPIDDGSERVVIGIPIKGDPDFVFNSIKVAFRGEEFKLGSVKVLKLETVEDEIDELEGENPFDFPDDEPAPQMDEQKRFELFATKFVAVHKGYILVANNKDYMRKLLGKNKGQLQSGSDFLDVKSALAKLTDDSKIGWRQFGRLDKAMEVNYEMLRRGEMGNAQTLLARAVNRVFTTNEEGGESFEEKPPREQKLDGSKLPEDYANVVAPFLGPMGWVMETESDGWRITGVLLKKKGKAVSGNTETGESKDSQ